MNDSNRLVKKNPIRLPYFDWDKAKYFYYVAKLGSLSETGKFLNISQPSLSRKISILEDHLKCKLFTRTPKGLDLTRKGEELFGIIEQTFLMLKGFTYNAMVTADNGQKRKIRIATTHAMAAYIFNDLIHDYSKFHTGLVFELIGEDHLLDVLLNDVDITIHGIDESIKNSSILLNSSGIQKEYLFSTQKRLYASVQYLEECGEPQTVEELCNHRLIAFSHPERHPYADVNWILKLGMPEGKMHDPVFTSNSVECMIGAAKKGVGIVGSYPEMKIIKESKLKNIMPEVKDKGIKDYIIYPDYLKNDQDIIEFKNYLKINLTK
ncbi:MAG: LysR family transcriptional regulator [Alphaproteobacteria bacterium]|nr:LysR family transcriptional regulator [Alphaproteobacteria bacterium]